MNEGGERFNPNQLSVRTVIEFIDSQQEKKLSTEELREITVFTNEQFNEYSHRKNEWEIIYPVSLDEFVKKVGQFLTSQADEKLVIQGDTPVHLMRFTWFQVFRTMK